ncbi:MAG: S41 family peptidase [Azospirillaceae bacterium]|nr:S41 family peptidase [Azospirillaceae bacterium]
MIRTLRAFTPALYLLLALPVLMPTFAAAQTAPTAAGQKSDNTATYDQLNLFGTVFEQIRDHYVDPINDEQIIESAINGMLSALDPHSSYLNNKNFQDMEVETRGEFGGLGLEVSMEAGRVKVVSPIDGTPADRAGLKPGDVIVQLNGEALANMGLDAAVEKMRGPIGSAITLTIRRNGIADPFDVTLNRAVIKIQSVRYRVEQSVGYIRITTFTEQTQSGLDKALAEIKKEAGAKLRGYILDLRNNPGGLLDQAVSVANTFIEHGEIVSTRARNPADSQRFNATTVPKAEKLPLVVLINGGSASASEIVAGALQDHHRAVIMGTQSFGKGSVQSIIPLTGHGAMRLTIARYYTPSGRSIQQLGITPDIEVRPAQIEDLAPAADEREADLKGALRNDTVTPTAPAHPAAGPVAPAAAGKTPPQSANPPTPAATPSVTDDPLARAIDLIRGVALFNGQTLN